MRKYTLVLTTLLLLSGRASAYTIITASTGDQPVWPSMPIPFWINEKGSPQITNGSAFAAVQAAFQTWQNAGIASISFQYMGPTPVPTVGQDGLNLITFVDDTVPLGLETIASTFSFFEIDATGTLVIQEADIALSTSAPLSTSGEPGKYDLQSVLTHEAGHLLGLDHSALLSSVMAPYGRIGQLDQRTLSYDDIAGAALHYPGASVAALGAISGTILAGSTPVFGAHVVALDASGTALVSTISNPDGTYQIPFLPAGSYRLYAEPLNGAVTESNIGGTSSSFYHNLGTGFSTTCVGDVSDLNRAVPVQVFAGQSTPGVGIDVLPAAALNLTQPANFAARIPLGGQTTLTLGGAGLTVGDAFSASGSGMTLSNPLYSGSIASNAPTSAQINISVAANAAPGPKTIAVARSGRTSLLSGAVVITNTPPASIQVSPATGIIDGGTAVSISGQNFRSGAQVYFGGLAASGVQVFSSSQIQAITPSNIPGMTNVVVVNSDGTWGVQASTFSYTAQPPQITSVSPLAGTPGTAVTIAGTEFGANVENLDVRFNGVAASITAVSNTRITAVVPYGSATGPITVSVLGQTATGPQFTVMALAANTNLAPGAQQLLDASTANGGTSLSFGNTDDGTAIVSLPFAFTLFNKSYVSGSTIAIATNGWISLDAVTSPEYQNAPLPASSIQRPDGSIGSIPSALIAPFFGDLFIKPAGNVTVQTVGTTPDRKFIVEWSKAGILDGQGNDTGATLTFEAILYETSNDIQFVYGSVSGPSSDGSSATIGIQDSTRSEAIQSGYDQAVVSSGFSITYHFLNGSYVPPGTPTPSIDQTYTLTNRGGFSFSTNGSLSSLTSGYTIIQPAAGTPSPSGVAIFDYRANNVLINETGVPASPLLQGGRIYAEVGGAVNTGLAIANPNNEAATISFFFTDGNGADFGSGTTTIGPNGQIAKFLKEVPFNSGSNVHGTFTFSSDIPVAVIALRGLTNDRNEFLLSTLPVVDTSTPSAAFPITLPQFADGGGWTTQIILVNPGDSAANGNIRFTDANGQSVTLAANGQTLDTFRFSIPKRSSFKLLTAGSPANLQSGSVHISPDNGSVAPVPLAIFSNNSAGTIVSEAAVPAISGTALRMYVESSGPLGTIGAVQSGVAIANLSSNPLGVTFDLTALDGTPLANGSMTLPANGQAAKFLSEILPQVGQPVKGILRITTSGASAAVAGLRARYNERGDFLITTTAPAAESAAPTPSELVFPEIVDGGGYTTQFILFNESTSGSMSGDVRFMRQDGNPLGLNLNVN